MSAPRSPEATAEAFAHGAVALDGEVDVVRCRGPQALEYLQGQCSQDLSELAPGGTADALVLSVQGKLGALVRVWMLGPGDLAVTVAPGYGEAVHERLRRFKIRVKAELGLERWPAVQGRGPGATAVHEAALAALAQAGPEPEAGPGGAGKPAVAPWPGVDLVGSATLVAAAVARGDAETFEAARIEAGVPAMGSELDERTIPHEAGIVSWTVSFTKGCYIGQEVVARLDTYDKVQRRLVRVVTDDSAATDTAATTQNATPLKTGMALVAEGRQVGEVRTVAEAGPQSGRSALAYVRRGFWDSGTTLSDGNV